MGSILNFQLDISQRILKARKNFKKSPKERISREYIEGRLELLEQLWVEFLNGHKEIMRTVASTELKASDYIKNEIYDQTEDNYADYKCELKSNLASFSANLPPASTSTSGNDNKSPEIKLPKIHISSFSGNYSDWVSFHNLFCALIHSNKSLNKVQKLHYLKGYLVGEAEQFLRHIPITEDNYDRCWKLLEERYNNKKYICHHTLNRLFSQKKIVNESASSLKDLIDTTNDCLAALSNLGINISSWDVIIIHILTFKLDPESRRQWEFNVSGNNCSDLPTYQQFKEFLTNRYRAIEFLDAGTSLGRKSQTHHNDLVNKHKSMHVAQVKCSFCSEEHKLSFCKKFVKETLESRRNFVETNKICFNCLGSNHSAKFCRTNVKCRVCKRKHHSLLHPQGNSSSETIDVTRENEISKEGIASSSEKQRDPLVSYFSSGRVYKQALLATALVKVTTKKGNYMVRALLDQGSQCSFITESTVQLLGLKKSPVLSHISGLGGHESMSKGIVSLEIQSRVEPNFKLKINAYVLKSITAPLPASKIEEDHFIGINDLVLADPEYHTPNRIDLLLGVGIYNEILLEGLKRGPQGTPLAQATRFGWILSGNINKASRLRNINVLHCRMNDNELLKKFWELESEPKLIKEKMFTEDEKRCEEIFAKTTKRDDEGRYIVRLPLKVKTPHVTNSREIAEKRFRSLESKLGKNEQLKEKYKSIMNEYILHNHMELVPERDLNKLSIYLPHHGVVRDDKDTTPVRVVMDASCKGKNNKSLNDYLLVGPTLQPELRHLVLRWRVSPICLTADISKMYMQVKVNDLDVDYQRILWRDNTASAIEHYRLLRVTFGTASAPYLAVKALQQLAIDEREQYPLAAEKVFTDYYMDDLLTGCETKEEGIRIFKEMNELMAKGGFELMKWTRNCNELIQEMEQERGKGEVQDGLKIKSDETIKIVGLTWNRTDDTFRYTVTIPLLDAPVTKRNIISDISRFYDPLGWAGPSIIKSKIFIQKLWLLGIDWDETVPEHLLREWLTYREELKHLEKITIPRWIHTRTDDKIVELHGFSDASKMAYSAVIYSRVVDSKGRIHVSLLSAKTKVAPVKQVSIPRLELCGAVLLTKLIVEVATVLKIDKEKIHAWTDSTVVLAWINNHPSKWKVFVANRVSEILMNLDPHHWSHVSSKENPADAASKGLDPAKLITDTVWFNGPQFLRRDIINYQKSKNMTTELEIVNAHCAVLEGTIWERFSSLTRMIRVVAYVRRFINNCRARQSQKKLAYLSTQELNDTLTLCVRQYQSFYFQKEIEIIKQGGNLPKNSGLRALNPYLDTTQILRVGGRLEHSGLTEAQKHPILIPKKCHLSTLLIEDAHKQTLHGGPQLMLCYIQDKYCILGGKQLVRSCFRKCVTCVKNNAVPQSQLMGQLPTARVTPTRCFKSSGVDFAGPIQIRTAKGRGHKSHKGYICLFVCMATRAIHLEVVTDLTTEGFLQAFKRFVARRGQCTDMWSDNATNFTGAARELRRLFSKEQGSILQEVAESLVTNNCNWHFIPPQAPNFGGLWEAGVRSVKYHLKRVIGQSTLTFEEMSTVLSQVEACLNSRPLTAVTNSSGELTVLTPGHFLIGEPLVTPPDRNYEAGSMGSLRRWQHTQRMMQDFWRRWSQEYLTKFLHRYKWSTLQTQPTVGDVVIVREDNLPACRWLYGRVIATHPGSDHLVRVVTLKTKNGNIKRPISKICLLPISEQ